MTIVKPNQPSGVRDYLPSEMLGREWMFAQIQEVFQRYGFERLETPAFERRDVLGVESSSQRVFTAVVEPSEICGKEEIRAKQSTLRFDHTVPLARFVAANMRDLQFPFRRWTRGPVWRGERPQRGRFREFVQCDADIVGTDSVMDDAEIVALMVAVMQNLGIEKFVVRVNNRKLLNGLPTFVGFPEESGPDVLRILDKLDKIGRAGVIAELKQPTADGGMAFSDEQVTRLEQFMDISGETAEELLSAVAELYKGNEIGMQGVQELRELFAYADAMNVPQQYYALDLSIARGLGYYTGTVYETTLTDMPSIGSVFSGGRYDDLISRFSKQQIGGAVGASVGVDRLFVALQDLGMLPEKTTVVDVMVIPADDEQNGYAAKVTQQLRTGGINTVRYGGKGKTLGARIGECVKAGVPIAVIVGAEEVEAGSAQLKNLTTRDQESYSLSDLPEAVSAILNS